MTRRYIGHQLDDGGGQVEVHTAGRVSPLTNRGRPRAQGFGWGDRAAGSVSLARSILWDVLGMEASERVAITFAGDVLSRFPGEAFALDEMEVRRWLDSQTGRRLTSSELVEHLGSIALAEPEDEAETLRSLIDRCWNARSLVN